jgi:hypothetical protein
MGPANARAAPRKGPPQNVQHPAKDTEARSGPTVAQPTDLASWRERSAWAAAAAHLNAAGYAAAVPVNIVPYLRRRGLAVWAADERPPAETQRTA